MHCAGNATRLEVGDYLDTLTGGMLAERERGSGNAWQARNSAAYDGYYLLRVVTEAVVCLK